LVSGWLREVAVGVASPRPAGARLDSRRRFNRWARCASHRLPAFDPSGILGAGTRVITPQPAPRTTRSCSPSLVWPGIGRTVRHGYRQLVDAPSAEVVRSSGLKRAVGRIGCSPWTMLFNEAQIGQALAAPPPRLGRAVQALVTLLAGNDVMTSSAAPRWSARPKEARPRGKRRQANARVLKTERSTRAAQEACPTKGTLHV
jgi:hypothetical protein